MALFLYRIFIDLIFVFIGFCIGVKVEDQIEKR